MSHRAPWKLQRHYKKCRICRQPFDDQGWVKVTMCDTCYSIVPYKSDQCCWKCNNEPRMYICPNQRCQCPMHASLANMLNAAKLEDQK